MLKKGPQVSFEVYLETLEFSKSWNWFLVSCVDVWSLVSPKPSRTNSSSNWQSCSPCVDLQLCQLHHELDHLCLEDIAAQICSISWLIGD